jgi:Spy/CpxP family protein refolding chaperone
MEVTMVKRILLALTSCLLLAYAGSQALAQSTGDRSASQPTTTASQGQKDAGQAVGDTEIRARVEARLQKLSSELNLTDDQKNQLKPILQDEIQQLKTVHEDSSLSADQKKEKMTEIRQASRSKMRSVLTPEQQTKLDSMKESARDQDKDKD